MGQALGLSSEGSFAQAGGMLAHMAFLDDPTRSTLPIVTIDSPATLTTVGSSPVAITGTVDDDAVSLTVNGVAVIPDNGVFSANVTLVEGHNTIVARMVTVDGTVSTASVYLSLDMTPPYITVASHSQGQVV